MATCSRPSHPLKRWLSGPRLRRTPRYLLAFSAPPPDADGSLSGFRRVDRLFCGSALTIHSRRTVRMTGTGVTPVATQQSCSFSRRATLISLLYNGCVPTSEFLDRSLRRSSRPALKTHQPNRRRTDKLNILSWNPAPACRSDSSLLTSPP